MAILCISILDEMILDIIMFFRSYLDQNYILYIYFMGVKEGKVSFLPLAKPMKSLTLFSRAILPIYFTWGCGIYAPQSES